MSMSGVALRFAVSSIAVLSVWFGSYAMNPVQAAESNDKVVQNPQVAKELTEAKKQVARKQWDAALAALQRARAVPNRSAYADLKIDEYQGFILVQTAKPAPAAVIFEKMAVSSAASPAERTRYLDTAIKLHMQSQQYAKAAEAAGRALRERPDDRALLELIGQAQYQAKDFKRAAATMQRLVALTQKAGAKPKEAWLQVLLSSADQLGDKRAVDDSWETLLRYYPSRDSWKAVLSRRASQYQTDALALGYKRLRFDLGLLDDPGAFEDLALGAIDAGMPGEAVRVLQAGVDGKTLGRDNARSQRMLEYAKREATKSRATLTDMAGNAAKAATGQPSVALGQAYLGFGEYPAAINALSKGLEKGGLQDADRSRIDLGIAYLKDGKADAARRTFDSVAKESTWRDLAQLWKIRAGGA